MPFPVSFTSIKICAASSFISMFMLPRPSIESSAFFKRFSITQSNSGAFIIAITSVLPKVFTVKFTFSVALRFIYATISFICASKSVSSRCGVLPIFPKRSLTSLSRSTSLLISIPIFSLPSLSFNISTQPCRELSGVPSWCAVSFAMPAHTWFCVLLLRILIAIKVIIINSATTINCTIGKYLICFSSDDSP